MILFAAAALAAPLVDPEDAPHGIGLGLELGIPTGFTVAYRPGDRLWFAGGVGYSPDTRTFALHGDALFTLIDRPNEDLPDLHLPFWAGFGPRVRVGEGTNNKNGSFIAVRVPLGFGVWHAGVPWEGYFEVAPGIGFIPEARPICDIVLGVRYYPAALSPKAAAPPASPPAPSPAPSPTPSPSPG